MRASTITEPLAAHDAGKGIGEEMKFKIASGLVLSALLAGAPVVALAQHHDDHDNHGGSPHGYVQHNDWHKGGRMPSGDWNRGARVDYRSHHLNAPPRGYEWREVDGNYVLAGIATGIIASTIIASSVH
ncbi:MAG: RcnB family protein [Acidobacteriaceae bacterium]|nr:RcnB family protein [Acidobacteriaceae bacterium]